MTKLPLLPRLAAATALAVAATAAAAPPPNDSCASATTIPALELPFEDALDTTQATAEGDPAVACVTPAPGKTVWYTFRPETSDSYVLDASTSIPGEYVPVLALFAGGCGGLTPVANACGRSRITAALEGGTTYYLMVGGAGVIVDPAIRLAVNGVDLCPAGPGPGGGSCGTNFEVRVGETISARAYNDYNDSLLTTGTFAWNMGTNASPASGTGPSVSFQYTAPVESTKVTLTWTPPGQAPIVREITMKVLAAGAGAVATLEPTGPIPLASGDLAVLPSPGGQLRLSVRRDAPEWRTTAIVPSVASLINAAGVPYVSDLSVTNMEAVETTVGLEIWTAAGKRESSLIKIPAGGSKTIPDVVKNAFGLQQTFGALIVAATGNVTAGARTWAPYGSAGTTGQFALAGDIRSTSSPYLLRTGEVGVLTGVRQDSAFRTNVGVYNITDKTCVVEVEAHDEAGARVGGKLVLSVPPYRYVQETLASATGNNLPSGSLFVTNATTGCSVGSIAYVIDNVTQDPFAVGQRKKP